MKDEIIVYDDQGGYSGNVPAIADDNLMRVAEMAEKRIDVVVKIKQMALKVTNPEDWVDQNGKPYLLVSGSEKVANLFNISWRIDEPTIETEADGHFTYTLRGMFSIPGRSTSAEGSRSSKDPFFKKYDWVNGQKVEKPISAIDRRDVRMAALTNLLGNGITRLLGIRNMSYDDLEMFAGIKKEMITAIDYKSKGKNKEPLTTPSKKTEQSPAPGEEQFAEFCPTDVRQSSGKNKSTGKPWTKYAIKDSEAAYNTFSESFATTAKEAKEAGRMVKIKFKTGQYGNDIESVEFSETIPERKPGDEG